MALILALEGCMAVGKTSAAAYVQAQAPQVHVSFENTGNVIAQVQLRGLNKNVFSDYVEIQRLWIREEVERFARLQAYKVALTDFGAAEIEFYTLCYPRSIGADWDVEGALKEELAQLRACLPQRILFLDAREETLRTRKEADLTRSRSFFEHHLRRLMPLKREWFIGKEAVDVLNVDGLSALQEGEGVLRWVLQCERSLL